jgi:hypothetical protein
MVALPAKKFAAERWPKIILAAPPARNSAAGQFKNWPTAAHTAKKFVAEKWSKFRQAAPLVKKHAPPVKML